MKIGRLPLHAAEAPPELVVGATQCRLGLDAFLAGDVDEDHQQVAEFLGAFRCRARRSQLVELLADLVENSLDRGPVVPQVGGPFLHLLARGE